MNIVQVNVSELIELNVGQRRLKTGINKVAQQGSVTVNELGLSGDSIINTRHHGGPDQAVYLYSAEDYAFWSRQLGAAVGYGRFGENLTTENLDLSNLAVGDVLRSANLCLQVTAPRIPCSTFASWMNDRQFVRKFLDGRRPGAYCRVLTPGQVAVGDTFEVEPCEGHRISMVEFFADSKLKLQPEKLERYLSLPIDERSRRDFEAQLSRQRPPA